MEFSIKKLTCEVCTFWAAKILFELSHTMFKQVYLPNNCHWTVKQIALSGQLDAQTNSNVLKMLETQNLLVMCVPFEL